MSRRVPTGAEFVVRSLADAALAYVLVLVILVAIAAFALGYAAHLAWRLA